MIRAVGSDFSSSGSAGGITLHEWSLPVTLVIDGKLQCSDECHSTIDQCIDFSSKKEIKMLTTIEIGVYLFEPSTIAHELTKIVDLYSQKRVWNLDVSIHVLSLSRVGSLNTLVTEELMSVLKMGLSPIAYSVSRIRIYESVSLPEPMTMISFATSYFPRLELLSVGDVTIDLRRHGTGVVDVKYRIATMGQVNSFQTKCRFAR